MRIDLKCGEYLNFFKISRVEIFDHDIIKIKGNMEKGKKGITHQTHLQAIKNIKEFNRFLRKEMKEFGADGTCEYCGSLNVQENKRIFAHKNLNVPKAKNEEDDEIVDGYKCNACNRLFTDLKPLDLVIYYK